MKTNKSFKIILSTFIGGAFLLFAYASGKLNSNSETKIDYINTYAYTSGKNEGQLTKTIGNSSYYSGKITQEKDDGVDQIYKHAWSKGSNFRYNRK